MIHFETVTGPEVTRTAWMLHGILGSGRNWRGFARMLRRRDPSWAYVLPDLRNHGETGPLPGTADLQACADDLAALPSPDRVIGHSFGGKVALQWAATVGTAEDVWVLDSIPVSVQSGDSDVIQVLAALRHLAMPAADRADVRVALLDAGLSQMLVDWLLTSLKRGEDGWRWVYDLDAIDTMMASYFLADFGAWLERAHDGPEVHIVRAMRSDRWTPDVLDRMHLGPRATLHELADAGHWLHVDNPNGLAELLVP
ncbi:MAG: alpha/beta hydrolase [Alphaproteobacteria bacterium]|nr:alpha/beta hydrolase [Alphaproteobacteria bacterium]MCB9690543.1 alpha/beta hydrolase [Alphaproteobacteria bacterium]